jgi:outer membrane protein, heavy metal efflux system
MRRRATLSAALAALCLAAPVASAQPEPAAPAAAAPAAGALGPEEVLRSAVQSHPWLVAAAQERPLAEGDLQSAEGAFDLTWRTRASVMPLGYYQNGHIDTVVERPTPLWGASVFAGYRMSRGAFPEYDGKLETNPYGEVRAGAMVPIWRNGPIDRRRASIERAEIGLSLADLAVAQQRIEVVRLAMSRYWDWVAAGRRLAIARMLLGVAVARDQGLAERVARGDIPDMERTDNRRAILQREQQVVSAERSLQQAALELSLFLRRADGAPVVPEPGRLPPGFPEPSAAAPAAEREIQGALSRRPELGRVERQREQARVERAWAENQLTPAIDVQVVGSKDLGDGGKTRKPFELSASVLVDIPIDVDLATGRVKAAGAQLDRLSAQRRFAIDRIQTDVRDAVSAIEAALQRVRIARGELDLARVLERGEREKLDLGDSSLLIVNLREQSTMDAALREIDALADYHKSRAAFEAATASQRTPLP